MIQQPRTPDLYQIELYRIVSYIGENFPTIKDTPEYKAACINPRKVAVLVEKVLKEFKSDT